MTAPVDIEQSYQCTCFNKANLHSIRHSFHSVPGTGVEHFTIHGEYFLVVANEDGFIYTQDSVVYRWEAGKLKEFQRISTHSAQNTHYFTINTRKFLTFSNNKYDRNRVSAYEWKKETFSSKIQDIQIKYLSRCNIFSIHNITYIARGKEVISNTVSVLKWSGKQFESFKIIPGSSFVDCPLPPTPHPR